MVCKTLKQVKIDVSQTLFDTVLYLKAKLERPQIKGLYFYVTTY